MSTICEGPKEGGGGSGFDQDPSFSSHPGLGLVFGYFSLGKPGYVGRLLLDVVVIVCSGDWPC